MWVIYEKKSKKIISLSPNSLLDVEKEQAITEAVSGTVDPKDLSHYDALQVKDQKKAGECMRAYPKRLVVAGSVSKPTLVFRDPEYFSLYVKSDAPDKHPVDGIPEILADGKSSTLITIHKIDERFIPQRSGKDNEELYLRTTEGSLRDIDGVQEISKITLSNGAASFRLFSEKVKRVATVQILSRNESLMDRTLRIEFI